MYEVCLAFYCSVVLTSMNSQQHFDASASTVLRKFERPSGKNWDLKENPTHPSCNYHKEADVKDFSQFAAHICNKYDMSHMTLK